MSTKRVLAAFILCATQLTPLFSIETGKCEWVLDYVSEIPDFPKKGILFRWYQALLQNPEAFHRAIGVFADRYRDKDLDVIAGLDSRGFIFGAALAYELKIPFVPIRKPGKLPRKVERINYALEYGTNSFEIEVESISPGDRVLIIDDVLATGGTAQAANQLVTGLGGQIVEVAVLIELSALGGRDKVTAPVYSLIAIEK